jgi:hypothetical protein
LWRESGIRSRCNAVVREARPPLNTTRAVPSPNPVRSIRKAYGSSSSSGCSRKPLEQRRDGTQPSCHQLPAADNDLDYGTGHRHRAHAGQPGRGPVPTADVPPFRGVLRDVAADSDFRDAEQSVKKGAYLEREPKRSRAPHVREGDQPDSVVGSQEHLRAEAGQDPLMLDHAMAAGLVAEERKPDARHARIGLVVRLEHHRERLRFEHRPVIVGAPSDQRRGEAGHVPRS